MKGKSVMVLILLIAITIGVSYVAYFGIGKVRQTDGIEKSYILGLDNIKQGLDLKGGISIVYEADSEAPKREEMEAARGLIRERLDRKNYTEAEVAILGTDRLRVDIPGVDDPNEAMKEIGKTAQLKFIDEDGNILIMGTDVKNASYARSNRGETVVLEFTHEGSKLFEKATGENIGKIIYIVLDDEVLSAPTVSTKIVSYSAEITGNFTVQEAKDLAALIRSGGLPFNLDVISVNNVGARLGAAALESSLKAGVIGFSIVLVFMGIVYRLPGLCADIALFLYISLELIVLSVLGITITLPGIAGIVLSIGMAVDANVIIFERIKEELNNGRNLNRALHEGFSRAFPAIIDVNITTLIAVSILFWLGTGPIKGFAQTLSIGIFISMFTALVITRIALKALLGMGITNKKLYCAKNV